MPKQAVPLTAKQLETLPDGLHCDGRGLYLLVRQNSRSWIYRYKMRGGPRRDMGIGPLHLFSLAEARDEAAKLGKMVFHGTDPLVQRQAERGPREKAKKMTFRELAERYVADHRAEWRSPKSLAAWEGTLRDYAYPLLGNMPVGAIDTDHVRAVLAPIWEAKTETASRLRGRIETVLSAATAAKLREGENPAASSVFAACAAQAGKGREGRASCRHRPRRYGRGLQQACLGRYDGRPRRAVPDLDGGQD